MRIQLWSSNYDPEPTGIGPISGVWARAVRDRGHDVHVVTAHPHYPTPAWGRHLRPYRENREGIEVTRLPLWAGRSDVAARLRQDITFVAALGLAAPFLGTADVIVAVSPSFPALVPARVDARLRRIPWVMWLQDILPDAAAVTGLLDERRAITRVSRRLEKSNYASAARVVGISESFRENLQAKGVPAEHVVRIYNPATRPIQREARPLDEIEPSLVMNMGNIGHSQNLAAVVRAFESSDELTEMSASFVLAGDGVAGDEVRSVIRTDRVEVTGILAAEDVDKLLRRAAVGLVTQHPRDHDFNVPSKLMNFMGAGVPVIASVDANSEVARIIRSSGGGWFTDSRHVDNELAATIVHALRNGEERAQRGEAARRFALENFDPAHIADAFEGVLLEAVAARSNVTR